MQFVPSRLSRVRVQNFRAGVHAIDSEQAATRISAICLGGLETEFMENIVDDINLPKTTIVFATHHGRQSGKIPDSRLEKLYPQIIVIGEAPSRHLHYYTGYQTIIQNQVGDITLCTL